MASDGLDPVLGYPIFDANGGLETGNDLTEIARFAAQVGNRRIGTTAERNAFQYPVNGSHWFDTTLGLELRHNGTAWRAAGPTVQRITVQNLTATTDQRRAVTVTLPTPIDATRGYLASLGAPSFPTNGALFLATAEYATSGTVSTVRFAYGALYADYASGTGTATIIGYPAVT